MQDREWRQRKTPQRCEVVEIGDDGDDAVGAQARDILRAAHDADDSSLCAHHLRGTQGDVTAADQENPDQIGPSRAEIARAQSSKMTFEITIKPSEHAFPCEQGETVLAAAMRADLMLPYGCRNGACGTCKGKILAGDVDYGEHQKSTLTEDEKRIGYALFCVAKPLTDVTIEVREVRRAGRHRHQAPAVPPRVDRQGRADVAIVRFKLPANERLQFLAGQYIDFLLKDGKRRSFSLATAAARRQAPRAPHPPRAERLVHRRAVHASTRDARSCGSRAAGLVLLREQSDKPIVFVAGGTGVRAHQGDHRARAAITSSIAGWCSTGARARAPDLYLPGPARAVAARPRQLLVRARAVRAQARGRTGPAARASCIAR
jgi:CDP-4-dehydro-6-deoxyglucose reductase